MIISVNAFRSEGQQHWVEMEIDGKAQKVTAIFDTDRPVPKFFHELFAALYILSPWGPLWELKHGMYVQKKDIPLIDFHGLGTKAIGEFIQEAGYLLGLAEGALWELKIVSKKLPDIAEDFKLTDKVQLMYSGGKESSLLAYMLHEIYNETIDCSTARCGTAHLEGRDWLPGFVVQDQFEVHPYGPWREACGIVHALWNGNNTLTAGNVLAENLPRPNQYTICGEAFFGLLEEYMRAVVPEFHITSLICGGMRLPWLRILKERYPEPLVHLDCDLPFSCEYPLFFLYLGIPFPVEIVPTASKCFKTAADNPHHYSRILHRLEIEHVLNKLRLSYPEIVKDNPLAQTGRTFPWVERINTNIQPRVLAEEVLNIASQHVILDNKPLDEIFTQAEAELCERHGVNRIQEIL